MPTPTRPPPQIHAVVSVLCVFMILWVAVLPGSWKGMISKEAAQQQEDVIPAFLPLQKNITSKWVPGGELEMPCCISNYVPWWLQHNTEPLRSH